MILLDQTSCDLLRYLIQLKEPETIMTITGNQSIAEEDLLSFGKNQ